MPIVHQRRSRNYFVSIDFVLRTALFLLSTSILILQHVLSYCKPSINLVSYGYFSPSFGTNSWSATGLYVTCWAMIILYSHTISLVFWDNFQVHLHATTFVIYDMITSIFFLAWTIMNIIQLSNCSSERQRSADGDETPLDLTKFLCGLVPCSFYLAPSIASFMAMFVAISLAASAFRKVNFYKIPRYIRDNNEFRITHTEPTPSNVLASDKTPSNKPFYPFPKFEMTDQQQAVDVHGTPR